MTDEQGIHIMKHVSTCFHCGRVDGVRTALDLEICPECAVKIVEVFG